MGLRLIKAKLKNELLGNTADTLIGQASRMLYGAALAYNEATTLAASWIDDQREMFQTDQEKFRGTLASIFQDELDLVTLTQDVYNPGLLKKVGVAFLAGAATLTVGVVGGIAVLKLTGLSTLLMGGLKIVGGFTGKYLGFALVGLSFSAIVSTLIQTTNFVLNFNLNISDAELDDQLVSNIEALYGLVGNTIGTSMGWLVCGALPGSAMFAFNPMMAAHVMKDLDEEGKDEVTAAIAAVTRSAFQTLINAKASQAFKSTRRWLKRNPNGVLARLAKKVIGEENFRRWGESNRPSFTIKKDIIDKKIETIQDKNYRQLIENVVEEFGDSCMEAGMTLANSADAFLAAQALMNQGANTGVGIA